MQKKQECAKYLDTYLEKSQGNDGMVYLRREVCYDKTLNTCILIEHMIPTSAENVEASITDLLPNKIVFDQVIPINSSNAKADNVGRLIDSKIDCIK